MKSIGLYKGYKLYEVTEKDIAESGGAAESRYIKNSVLIYLPDEDNPKLGFENYQTNTLNEAEKIIDSLESDVISIKSRIEAAREQSINHERNKRLQNDKECKKREEHNLI